MSEEKKQNNNTSKPAVEQKDNKGSVYAKKKQFNKKKKGFKDKQEKPEFDQKIVDIARVTRVMAGGKRMSFRACVAIGDRKGRVAIGIAKGADVTIAVNKAVNKAKKEWITVPMVNDTIPHEIYYKHGAAKILLKPARRGKGVIAGGAARMVLELAGVKNVTSKILGTNNKVNIVKGLLVALQNIKRVEKPKNENKDAKKTVAEKEEKGEKKTIKKENKK